MKKKILFTVLLISFLFIGDYIYKFTLFNKNIEHIESVKNSKQIFLMGYFEEYYLNNDEYPKNIFELDSTLIDFETKNKKDQDKDWHIYVKNTIIDPFNNNGLCIVPIYNRNNKRVEDIYVLSAGVDKECNNLLMDSIYTDDAINLNLYKNSKFSYFDYYFGKKDILIFHLKGNHFLRNQIMSGQKCSSSKDIFKLFERKHPLHRVVCITGKVDSLSKSNTRLNVFFNLNNGKIICTMDKLYKFNKGDTIQIIAVYKRNYNNSLYFSNCFPL